MKTEGRVCPGGRVDRAGLRPERLDAGWGAMIRLERAPSRLRRKSRGVSHGLWGRRWTEA